MHRALLLTHLIRVLHHKLCALLHSAMLQTHVIGILHAKLSTLSLHMTAIVLRTSIARTSIVHITSHEPLRLLPLLRCVRLSTPMLRLRLPIGSVRVEVTELTAACSTSSIAVATPTRVPMLVLPLPTSTARCAISITLATIIRFTHLKRLSV